MRCLKHTMKKLWVWGIDRIFSKIHILLLYICLIFTLPLTADEISSADSNEENSKDSIRKVNLGTSIVREVNETKAYQSGETINAQMLEPTLAGMVTSQAYLESSPTSNMTHSNYEVLHTER
ncbi:hypothetical protein [uncultured Helicobacter sp.]|uniref:hypothetical protein n=1 Tax=uncultured Helicobacter sp. TaxID=175537 RepID=UPI002607BF31|nr:hypothetical protein [uncultured Helicobacter sp.]